MKSTFKIISLASILLASAVSCSQKQEEKASFPMVAAHRGCWLENKIPENSLSAVRMAARYGYPAIECDVKYTSDSVMVLMHDNTINRTMRNAADYSEIAEPVVVTETSFEELRTKYVFASDVESERTQLPTLEEELNACKQYGITPILHSEVYESFELAQKMLGNNWVYFNGNFDMAKKVRDFSECMMLLDPGQDTADNTVAKLQALGGKCGMSSMKYNMVTPEFCSTVKAAGFDVQSSIWPTPYEEAAISEGATIILSDFCWLQNEGKEASDKFSIKNKSLAAGDSINYTGKEKAECSGFIIEFDADGPVQLTVNGTREYSLNAGKHVLGFRMSDARPTVKLSSQNGCTLKQLNINSYTL